jgi:hypothetical protein
VLNGTMSGIVLGTMHFLSILQTGKITEEIREMNRVRKYKQKLK